MSKSLVAKSGHGDGWSVELDGGGGSARRGLAGASRPGFSRGYSIPNRAQKVREKVLRLTRGSWWPERPCRVDAGEDRRRSRGGARGRGRGSGLRAPGRCGSTRRAPTKPVEWSERAERHQRQAIADGATSSPEVVPARFRRYSRRMGRKKCTGSSLESWRGQRGARGGLRCSGATGPRRSRGAARPVARRRPLGLGMAARGMGWGFIGLGRYL